MFKSQEEAEAFSMQEYFRLDREAEHFAQKYDIASFIAVNQLVAVSLTEWLGLKGFFVESYGIPDPLKKALAFEVARIGRERESKRKDQEREMKMAQTEFNGKLNFGPTNTSFGKVYQ